MSEDNDDFEQVDAAANAALDSKIREHVCPACNGTGYPVVRKPVQPGRKIYPVKCKSCDGKGKVTDAN